MTTLVSLFLGIAAAYIFENFLLGILRILGFYLIVQEGTSVVLMLFGKVVARLDEPGIHFLWFKLFWKAPVIHFLGQVHRLDMRLDQQYLRSQPVNSEEGAPMGVGVWYEMYISDPVAFLFRNADPRGSLAANVSSSTVRCLSNMPLAEMLESRHAMSQSVRSDVTVKSSEWGYRVGSVYIRKVHFRDQSMIRQIESKIVNQLRQVTAAIRQDGENQVNVITSGAQRQAAAEIAKAAAIRPSIVGDALRAVSQDTAVAEALFDVLEAQRMLDSNGTLVMLPRGNELLAQLLASRSDPLPLQSSEERGKRQRESL
jgi:regulator of protease activity HflC (stomatin/prohibitin superfamily)